MSFVRTLRFNSALTPTQRDALHARAHVAGIALEWGPNTSFPRTYARVETDKPWDERGDASYDETIIGLAIEPSPSEALPAIHDALCGNGAPAGVLACERAENALIVEVRPESAYLAITVTDAELARFHGYRRVTLLTPLSCDDAAAIAARGLAARELVPERVLETLIANADL